MVFYSNVYEGLRLNMRDLSRSISLMLILMMGGMFLISNLAEAKGGDFLVPVEVVGVDVVETKAVIVHHETARKSDRLCGDICGVMTPESCVKHCELSHAVSICLSTLSNVVVLARNLFFYRDITPDQPQLVELKPPQFHLV